MNVIYRGVKSAECELIPKVGRRRRKKKPLQPNDERYILTLFKQRAIAHLQALFIDRAARTTRSPRCSTNSARA